MCVCGTLRHLRYHRRSSSKTRELGGIAAKRTKEPTEGPSSRKHISSFRQHFYSGDSWLRDQGDNGNARAASDDHGAIEWRLVPYTVCVPSTTQTIARGIHRVCEGRWSRLSLSLSCCLCCCRSYCFYDVGERQEAIQGLLLFLVWYVHLGRNQQTLHIQSIDKLQTPRG